MNKEIPLFKVRNEASVVDRVTKVLNSGFTGQGPVVEELELKLWNILGSPARPLTVNSCTSAIDLAMHSIGVGPGDEVISTPFTCVATQVSAIHRMARIRWADIDPLTGCIDPKSVEKLINRNTKAIIAVDWAGRACDYKSLREIGDKYEMPIIEDAAHCWDTRTKEGYSINTHGGDYVCYSFQSIKFVTGAGDGGLLLVQPEEYEQCLLWKWYGMDRRTSNQMRCLAPLKSIGFKYHMNDVSAACVLGNLENAELVVMSHRTNAAMYDVAFNDLTSVTCPPADTGCSYWLYSLLVEKGTKEQFMEHLAARGIASSPVHHRNDMYEATAQFREGPLPGLDSFSAKQVSIPVGYYLSPEDKERIIDAVRSY